MNEVRVREITISKDEYDELKERDALCTALETLIDVSACPCGYRYAGMNFDGERIAEGLEVVHNQLFIILKNRMEEEKEKEEAKKKAEKPDFPTV